MESGLEYRKFEEGHRYNIKSLKNPDSNG